MGIFIACSAPDQIRRLSYRGSTSWLPDARKELPRNPIPYVYRGSRRPSQIGDFVYVADFAVFLPIRGQSGKRARKKYADLVRNSDSPKLGFLAIRFPGA